MAESKGEGFPKTHRAVRWHPPSYDVRVEDVPFPKWVTDFFNDSWSLLFFEICRIEHPDDAIVKITVRMYSRIILSGGD